MVEKYVIETLIIVGGTMKPKKISNQRILQSAESVFTALEGAVLPVVW